MEKPKRIGIMTGGGDCPGLNAAIRAVTQTAIQAGYEVTGFRDGWKGLIEKKSETLDSLRASGIIDRGGTILGTSRFSPLRMENGPQKAQEEYKAMGLSGLIVLGGNGTLSIAGKLYREGLPVVGIPKTIDNDVAGTDYSIGFQTAVQIATDALDRLRSTADSHHRVMLLEVMGRNTGWIAVYSGMAAGADAILIPEIPFTREKMEELCQMVGRRNQRGKRFSIIVVAEGVKTVDIDGLSGWVGEILAKMVEKKTGLETRFSSLDYIQRGGTPVTYDRNLATSLGIKAVEMVKERKFGEMAALRGNRITNCPLEQAVDREKPVSKNIYNMAARFFG